MYYLRVGKKTRHEQYDSYRRAVLFAQDAARESGRTVCVIDANGSVISVSGRRPGVNRLTTYRVTRERCSTKPFFSIRPHVSRFTWGHG